MTMYNLNITKQQIDALNKFLFELAPQPKRNQLGNIVNVEQMARPQYTIFSNTDLQRSYSSDDKSPLSAIQENQVVKVVLTSEGQ